MATSTPYLNLALLATGESVGTWGIPLNNNFSKIDVLAGEVINGRGPEGDLDGRFNAIEQEIIDARGVMPALDDRLSVLLQSDGNIIIEAVPTSSQIQIGVTRLSVNPTTVGMPIAVGDNDGRMLTQGEHDELVTGGNTALHKHLLINGASDVQATYAEINQAIYGIGGSVTSANLTTLTDGSAVPNSLHTHPPAGFANHGFIRLSVTAADINDPVAVGDNDPRMLTQGQHDELVLSNPTALHKHLLVDGASDLVVTATVLNQLAGSSNKVTATNLNILTEGSPVGTGAQDATQLHHHDSAYYRKAEVDTHLTNLSNEIDSDIDTHNTADISHTGANFNLGDVIMSSLAMSEDGEILSLHKGGSDLNNTPKLVVRDGAGVSKAYIDSEGDITCNNITVNGDQTLLGDSLVETSFTINGWLNVIGDTTLGDGTDFLVANCITSTFNGDIALTGGITGATGYNGIDIVALDAAQTATQAEVTTARKSEADLVTQITKMETATTTVSDEVIAARNTEASLDAKIDAMDATTLLVTNEVNTARGGQADLDTRLDNIEASESSHTVRNDNPHLVTITQAVNADGGTDITINELETLTDGADADGLHFHESYSIEIENSKTSPVLPGSPFASMSSRLDAGDQVSENIAAEIIDARTDIYAVAHVSLDARLDTRETEFEAWQVRADNPHTVTLTQSVSADGTTDVTGAELETLTNTSNADALHVHDAYAITTLEVETARGGQGTLDARLDTMDTGLATHEARNDNPHTVTITQAVSADTVSTLTIAALEGVTDGGDADGLHLHTKYDTSYNEVVAARDSTQYGVIYGSLDGRLEVSETEIVNARNSNVFGAYSTLDGRLEASDSEINVARGGTADLNTRLGQMDTTQSTHESNAANPHTVTLTQSVSADSVSTVTVADLEAVTAGGGVNDADLQHSHATYDAKVNKYIETVASAATWTITHSLNTKDVTVTVYDDLDVMVMQAAITSITTTDVDTVDIVFGAAQVGRVVITG